MEPDDIDISVVIPVYNEEENVGPLMQELDEALTSTGKKFEVICVNDARHDKCSGISDRNAVRRYA